MLENILKAFRFLATGQFQRVWNEVHVRLYRLLWAGLWWFLAPPRQSGRPKPSGNFTRETKYPIAFASPDHLAPKGTAVNNSTHKKFILFMDDKLHREFGRQTLRMMDLGCAGGQTVADFMMLQWEAAGLEGSDFSLKHRRANWARLANRNLFTCDITKPYQMKLDGQAVKFHLITAWEVLEHIATPDLLQMFTNIRDHLEPGGYFIASTTFTNSVHLPYQSLSTLKHVTKGCLLRRERQYGI